MAAGLATAGKPNGSRIIFSTQLAHPSLACLWDHSVNGQALMPGAAFLLAAFAAADKGAAVLTGATFARPMLLDPQSHLQVTLSTSMSRLEVGSGHSSADRRTNHLMADVCSVSTVATAAADDSAMEISQVWQTLGNARFVKCQPADAATTASVVINRSSQQDWESPGAHIDPMALDATLHAGAVERARLTGPSALLVPAGLQAFVPAAKASAYLPKGLGMNVSVLQLLHPQPSSKLSTHSCSSGAPAQGLIGVHGLLSRPTRPLAASSQPMAANGIKDRTLQQSVDATAVPHPAVPHPADGLQFGQYAVTWQAEGPDTSSKSSVRSVLPVDKAFGVQQPLHSAPAGTAGSLMQALRLAQTVMARGTATQTAGSPPVEIQFTTFGAFSSFQEIVPHSGSHRSNRAHLAHRSLAGGVEDSTEAAGLWAFFRAAVLEAPHSKSMPLAQGNDADMLSATSSPYQPGLRTRSPHFVLTASSTPADPNGVVAGSTFGVRAQAGVQSSAVLMPMRHTSSALENVRSRSGSCGGLVAITGGMGALGALSAGWVGHGTLGTGCQLLLMGRAGRISKAGSLGIMGADGAAVSVTLLACDASAAEDASCMLSQTAAAGSGEQPVQLLYFMRLPICSA